MNSDIRGLKNGFRDRGLEDSKARDLEDWGSTSLQTERPIEGEDDRSRGVQRLNSWTQFWKKLIRFFLLAFHRQHYYRFLPPPPPPEQNWFELVCYVNNVYLKTENSQDYVQKPQLNCTLMNLASYTRSGST